MNCKKNVRKSKRKQERIFADFFKKEAEKSSNVKHYQFWRHDNKPIELWRKVIQQKINCFYNNPVEEGLVYRTEDYLYSSAIDCSY